MNPPERERKRLFKALQAMWDEYPDYRFAQMIVNVSYMARGPAVESTWDVEDDELTDAIRDHLQRRTGRDIFAESEPATANNKS